MIHAYDLVELIASWQQVCDHRQPAYDAAIMMVMEHGINISESEQTIICDKLSALLNSANMPMEDVDMDEVAEMLTPPDSPHGMMMRRLSFPRSAIVAHSQSTPALPSIMCMLSEQDGSNIESYNFALQRYMDVITPVPNMLSELDLG